MNYGYARVSTDGQTLDVQQDELKSVGCVKVYAEKISGARSDRPELYKVLAKLKAGDVLVVSRLDRLARSIRDLLNIIEVIREAGASFKSLNDPWADSTTPHGELMLQILGSIAQFERSLIKARTDAGRQRAKANGVRFGRKPKLTEYQRTEAIRRRAAGESLKEIGCSYNVSHMTIARLH